MSFAPIGLTEFILLFAADLHDNAEKETNPVGKAFGHTFSRIIDLTVLPIVIVIESSATIIWGGYVLLYDAVEMEDWNLKFDAEKVQVGCNILYYGADLLFSIFKYTLQGAISPKEAAMNFDPADYYRANMVKGIEEYENEVTSLKSQINGLSANLQDHKCDNLKLKLEIKDLVEEIGALEKEIATLETEKSNLKEMIDNHTKKMTTQETLIQENKIKIGNLELEKERLKGLMENLNRMMTTQGEFLEKDTQEIGSLEKDNYDLKQMIVSLKEIVTVQEKLLKEEVSKINDLKIEKNDLTKMIEELSEVIVIQEDVIIEDTLLCRQNARAERRRIRKENAPDEIKEQKKQNELKSEELKEQNHLDVKKPKITLSPAQQRYGTPMKPVTQGNVQKSFQQYDTTPIKPGVSKGNPPVNRRLDVTLNLFNE